MDEACCSHFSRCPPPPDLNSSLAWTYSYGLLLYVAMLLARTLQVSSLPVSYSECVKDLSRRDSWLSVRCFTHEENTLLVLAIGVSVVMSCRPRPISPLTVLMNGTGSYTVSSQRRKHS
jgi:hypothetical protein